MEDVIRIHGEDIIDKVMHVFQAILNSKFEGKLKALLLMLARLYSFSENLGSTTMYRQKTLLYVC